MKEWSTYYESSQEAELPYTYVVHILCIKQQWGAGFGDRSPGPAVASGQMNSGESFNLSKPQIHHLHNGENVFMTCCHETE